MVQAESDPIADRRERLRALRVAAELASADQGDEEPEKQPPDTTAAEQQKEDPAPVAVVHTLVVGGRFWKGHFQ
ncbi:unnamed protein product [Sphagnum troendelagicum]|uniref:Uncharacterized protein n=1 Tax=Sphagnum troendelagicum TaxID=128251 RepID=A0ABP0U5U3_9BRYO